MMPSLTAPHPESDASVYTIVSGISGIIDIPFQFSMFEIHQSISFKLSSDKNSIVFQPRSFRALFLSRNKFRDLSLAGKTAPIDACNFPIKAASFLM